MKIGRIGNNYGNIVTNGKIIINGKEYTGIMHIKKKPLPREPTYLATGRE